jgi:GcrA cell cycle regulator
MFTWSDERVSLLLLLWRGGLSAREVGITLGTSRNSVIGKLDRLGESRPGTQRDNGSRGGRAVRKQKPPRYNYRFEKTPPELKRPGALPAEPPFPFRMPSARAIGHHALDGLRPRDCRWPIGDPRTPEFRFCGVPTAPDRSYCAHHYEASIKQKDRADDKD